MKPKITLALFNYCQAKYLPDSLKAISSQTDKPDEFYIFDDASTDNSLEILKEVPGAKFHFNEKNMGLLANVEKVLEIAEHDFIVLSAADDVLHPNFIEEHRKLLEQNPNLGLSCSDCVFFLDEQPKKYEIFRFLPYVSPQIFQPKDTVEISRKTGFTLLSFTCVYNRHLLKQFGGYNNELRSLADFYLNTQIALRYPIGYIPKPLSAARVVKNSYGEAFRRNWDQRAKIYDKLFKLVYEEEDLEFQNSFTKARLMSFGGLYTLYYMLCKPKYWSLLPGILLKNWKHNLYKIYCILLGKPFPRMPVKALIGEWP